MLQDAFSGLAGPGHRTGVGPLERHPAQVITSGGRLSAAVVVEGNIDLSLEAPLAVPVGFPMAHQQQARTGAFGGEGAAAHLGMQMRGAVERFDLHR